MKDFLWASFRLFQHKRMVAFCVTTDFVIQLLIEIKVETLS